MIGGIIIIISIIIIITIITIIIIIIITIKASLGEWANMRNGGHDRGH